MHKGASFMAAMRSALWNTADRPGHNVFGISGEKIPLLGYVNLIVTAGGKDVEIPFAITPGGADMIIVGTPGLRALGFTLQSPLFENVDLLQPPERRQRRKTTSKMERPTEQTAPQDTVAPTIAPKLVDILLPLTPLKKGRKKNTKKKIKSVKPAQTAAVVLREVPSRSNFASVKAGGQATNPRDTRDSRAAKPKGAKDTVQATTPEVKAKATSRRAAGKKKDAAPVESVDKAKPAPRHSDRVIRDKDTMMNVLEELLKSDARAREASANSSSNPKAQVFSRGDGAAITRLKC